MTNKKIHLIGIGGVSMSGIALLLQNNGNIITGSDMQSTDVTDNLISKGIKVTIGTDKENIKDVDVVIYTAAIKEDNEELVEAKRLNKELYDRSLFMGMLCKCYKNVICIAGTHGKSTTTGMTSMAFLENKLDPTILVGANLPCIGGNCHIGLNDYLILETCEYKDSFLHFYPTSETILNIDDDHLDYFKNIDNIKKSFKTFMNIETNKNLVINIDDNNIKSMELPNLNIITYGIKKDADLSANNISYDDYGHPVFDVCYKNELLINLHLNIVGIHNVYNSLATIAQSIIFNLDIYKTKLGIEKYTGVERRFDHLGTYKNNIEVYDDYAHHPTEISSTVNSVKSVKHNESYAIFQSHTYSRTIEHLKEFADELSNFDHVIIAPIYPARETNIWGVKETDLVKLIKTDAIYINSFDKIVDYLKENLKDNDLVITIGAGPVNKVGQKLLQK